MPITIQEYLSGIFPREFKANQNGFHYNKIRYKYSELVEEHLLLTKLNEADVGEAEILEFLSLNDKKKSSYVVDQLSKIERQRLQSVRDAFAQDNDELFEVEFDPLDFILLNDLSTDRTLVYSKPLQMITDISHLSLLNLCTKNERATLTENVTPSKFIYDPYNLVPFVKQSTGHYEYVRVNLYSPPEWLKSVKARLGTPAKMPPIIQEFLDHLFPDKKALKYTLNWFHYALTQRNETYLVLNGKKGAGKGILCDLAKMLVGEDNYGIANESLLSKEFNAVLDKKRLVNYDEQKIGKGEHTRLKRYINKHQNIEKKGIDADKASEIFNSYIITNNDVTDMYLETDDRRFSVVEMCEIPLKTVWSKAKIEHLVDLIETDQETAEEFGRYIYQFRDKEFDVHIPFIGPTFFNLCYYSLKAWQRYMVDKIITGDKDQWTLRELKRGVGEEAGLAGTNKYFPSNAERVNDFLKNYLHSGSEVLGELIKDEDNSWIIKVNPKYIEESTVETHDHSDIVSSIL